MTLGILTPPPIERVDLEPRALPPIVERADSSSDADQPFQSHTDGEPESEEIEDAGPAVPRDDGPSAVPEVAGRRSVNGQPSALLDCVIVGPVETRDALEAVGTRLRSTGALVDFPEQSGVAPVEYVVYIGPVASLDDALLVVQRLEARSIQDVAPLPDENEVSVGVYRNRNRAAARRDQIAALGHDVKVREREAGRPYRLRVRGVSDDALGDLAYEPCGTNEAG
ncbi:MAG: SPOR domain-containing protein [Gammaproteobacteria bacterium]|nr:SPOR domain-containing protein [Gammaproteobacteria bacterium]